ncbi:hypothetical protein A2U01_0072710, partial [Trifolium medium]|nr:hypothetical protein [Trifolium medium]
TPEDRLKFLAKARQQKTEPAAEKPDPLTQLIVEDKTTKGGKRNKKAEAGRISMAIPNKGDAYAAAAGGGIVEAVQPSPKKRKTSISHKGRILGLTS